MVGANCARYNSHPHFRGNRVPCRKIGPSSPLVQIQSHTAKGDLLIPQPTCQASSGTIRSLSLVKISAQDTSMLAPGPTESKCPGKPSQKLLWRVCFQSRPESPGYER